jgi:hypothetical protein
MKPLNLTKLCCKKMNLFAHMSMINADSLNISFCLNGLYFLAQRANLQLCLESRFRGSPMIICTLMLLWL